MKKEFKLGDKVVMKGKIETIGTAGQYVVGVKWENDQPLKYYLTDGRAGYFEKSPTIFHDTTQERVVQVRDNEINEWVNRVLLMQKNDKYICWEEAETIEEAKKEMYTIVWRFMREVPEKRVITMQEIADKFNIDVELIEIYL
jgi:hypothetical protein